MSVEKTGRPQLSPELFNPVQTDIEESEKLSGPPIGFWKDSWIRLKKNKGAIISLAVILILMVLAIVGPWLTPYNTFSQDVTNRFAGPSAEHWFGTDSFGRDLFTRVWDGTRVSLYIAFLAAFIDLVIGVAYGSISGFVGGRVDDVMQRIIEILYGIPNLVILVLIMLILQPGILTITLALVITGWAPMARLVRARVLQLKEQEFSLASLSLGAGGGRLIRKHLLPNSLGIIIIQLMFTIPNAIFFEAFLSFIGLGIQVPQASLGALINDGYTQLRLHPHVLWFPVIVFSLLMLAFNLFADGLRDAFDPKMRK
ncbi:MAG: ABC transporter permease [Rubrobacteraceae bacterium]